MGELLRFKTPKRTKPKVFSIQLNTLYKQRVVDFLTARGFKPQVEILEEPPACGVGQLCRISAVGFEPFKLDPESLRTWSTLL